MSTLTSQGFFSACATRRMMGRPIPKSTPAIASPTIGLDGRATPRMTLQHAPRKMAPRFPGRSESGVSALSGSEGIGISKTMLYHHAEGIRR